MKNSIFLFLLTLFAVTVSAQQVEVNRKTGLVTLNGREFCYIVPAAKGSVKQFNVQNLQGKNLIFVSENEGRQYDPQAQSYSGDEFRIVFLDSHNWCTANSTGLGYNNYLKIAKLVASERLLQNDAIWPESERIFVRKHHGVFNTRIEPGTAPAPAPASTPNTAAPINGASTIRIAGDKVYLGERLIGSFTAGGPTETQKELYTIYGPDDVQVAVASRGNNTSDWTIRIVADNKSYNLRYYADRSLERVFQLLVDKGLLR